MTADHKAAKKWCEKYGPVQKGTTLGNLAAAYLDLDRQLRELREAAKKSLDCREKEASAILSAENAKVNFHHFQHELDVMENAMCAASAADDALRKLLEVEP